MNINNVQEPSLLLAYIPVLGLVIPAGAEHGAGGPLLNNSCSISDLGDGEGGS